MLIFSLELEFDWAIWVFESDLFLKCNNDFIIYQKKYLKISL